MKIKLLLACLLTMVGCIFAVSLPAQELITNGGFESGFTGWIRVDQTGSEGTWAQQTGTTSPVNAFSVATPPEGTRAAMTDAQGPGSHVLYQDFTVPVTLSAATLQFELFLNNHAIDFFSPPTLDFSTPTLNQQLRVDITTTSADPFSVAAGDILLNIYQTQPGNNLVTGYNTVTSDLTTLFSAHPGETLRLRFAEADNVNFFNAGIDAVSISVPEPTSLGLIVTGLGLIALGVVRQHRRLL
jgi:hypothetical protein